MYETTLDRAIDRALAQLEQIKLGYPECVQQMIRNLSTLEQAAG